MRRLFRYWTAFRPDVQWWWLRHFSIRRDRIMILPSEETGTAWRPLPGEI
jgi:hypothetical protein